MTPSFQTLLPFALCAAFAITGCNANDTPTSASSTETVATAASPSFTEEFTGALPVSGAAFYSFSVTQYGTVNVTLTSVGGTYVPSTVTMGLSIGVPSGETCAANSTVSTRSSAAAQLTGTYQPGVYCVMVSDVGNLFAPATFAVTIAFP